MKVQIDARSGQGHGRCYDPAPGLFGDDDEGRGTVLGDGTVRPGLEYDARLAAGELPRACDRVPRRAATWSPITASPRTAGTDETAGPPAPAARSSPVRSRRQRGWIGRLGCPRSCRTALLPGAAGRTPRRAEPGAWLPRGLVKCGPWGTLVRLARDRPQL